MLSRRQLLESAGLFLSAEVLAGGQHAAEMTRQGSRARMVFFAATSAAAGEALAETHPSRRRNSRCPPGGVIYFIDRALSTFDRKPVVSAFRKPALSVVTV